MIQEYQVIEQNYYRGLNLFLSKLFYRAPHYHRECELMMALEGEADVFFSNGKACHLAEGGVTVIGPMVMHEIRSGEKGVLLITIQTSFAMLEYFLSHRISPFFAADTDLSQYIAPDVRASFAELCFDLALSYPGMPEDDAGKCFLLQARLITLLFRLLPKAEGTGEDARKNRMREKTVSRILEYVDENFQHKLTLGEFAEKENLSLSYLSHAFKDTMGISFQEYVKRKRFENASRLLQASELNLLDISIASGFSDVRYMMKAFTELAECSPAEYRRSFREYSEENSRVAEIQQYYLTREEACAKLLEYRSRFHAAPVPSSAVAPDPSDP